MQQTKPVVLFKLKMWSHGVVKAAYLSMDEGQSLKREDKQVCQLHAKHTQASEA